MLPAEAGRRKGRGQVGMEEGAWHGRAGAVGTQLPTRGMAARQRAASISQFCNSYLSVSR